MSLIDGSIYLDTYVQFIIPARIEKSRGFLTTPLVRVCEKEGERKMWERKIREGTGGQPGQGDELAPGEQRPGRARATVPFHDL